MTANRTPERDRPGHVEVAERLVVAWKPGNAGGAKGLSSRTTQDTTRGRAIGDSLPPEFAQALSSALRATAKKALFSEVFVCLSMVPCPRAGCGKSARPVR